MAKFPEPPPASQLTGIPPTLCTLPSATRIWRVYFQGGRHPSFWDGFRSFGPADSRFDHHLPPPRLQSRKIFYAAFQGPTCLAEVFQQTRVIDRVTHAPWLIVLDLAGPVELLDLTGAWPTRAGASMALNTGPRPRARRWSQAIYEAYPQVAGLYYPSSMHANRPAVALYERASGTMPAQPSFHRPLVDPALLSPLKRAAQDLGYGLV